MSKTQQRRDIDACSAIQRPLENKPLQSKYLKRKTVEGYHQSSLELLPNKQMSCQIVETTCLDRCDRHRLVSIWNYIVT